MCGHRRFYVWEPRAEGVRALGFSHYWVKVFKPIYDICDYTRHGEGASTDTSRKAEAQMAAIQDHWVSMYDPTHVFNMDETGLFYRLEPNKTLVTKSLSSKKQHKECIAICFDFQCQLMVCQQKGSEDDCLRSFVGILRGECGLPAKKISYFSWTISSSQGCQHFWPFEHYNYSEDASQYDM